MVELYGAGWSGRSSWPAPRPSNGSWRTSWSPACSSSTASIPRTPRPGGRGARPGPPYLGSHAGGVELLGVAPRGGAPAPGGQLRRLPVLDHDGQAGHRAGHRGGRPRGDRRRGREPDPGEGAAAAPDPDHAPRVGGAVPGRRDGGRGPASGPGGSWGPGRGPAPPRGRPARNRGRRRGGVRDVRRAGRGRPLARGQPGQPPDPVHLPGLLPALHPPGGGRGPLPGGARPLPARPGVPARRRRLGRPPDPGAGRLLLPQLRPGPGGRLLPEPGRGHRVAAPAGGLGRRGRRQPGHDRPRARRRGAAGPAGRRGFECFLVPIDACYELVGLVRMHWKGFDGGQEAWEAIDGFFDAVRERSRPAEEAEP